MKQCSKESADTLISQYEMLMHPDQMGTRFKFFALLNAAAGREYLPPGFNNAPVNKIIR